MAEKLKPLYRPLKAETPINVVSELKQTFDQFKKVINDICELALKQPLLRNRLVLMTDASFKSASYSLVLEDNTE